jgi:hypothetical protein
MNIIALPKSAVLSHGSHSTYGEGACALEMADYLDRRQRGIRVKRTDVLTDSPVCVSKVVAAFGRSWNDSLRTDADRTRLLGPIVPLMLGTATTAEDEETRAWMATDWLVRTYTPTWLELAGLTAEADALRALDPVVDSATARASNEALSVARSKGDAARDAARAAARDAAWDAARDAARAAARDAARDAAWAAARAAAWDAARAAARDAARDAARAAASQRMAPTVTELQASACSLLRRMCAVGREVQS